MGGEADAPARDLTGKKLVRLPQPAVQLDFKSAMPRIYRGTPSSRAGRIRTLSRNPFSCTVWMSISQQQQGNHHQSRQKAEWLERAAEDRQANHLGPAARQARAELGKYAQRIQVHIAGQKICQTHQISPDSTELRP